MVLWLVLTLPYLLCKREEKPNRLTSQQSWEPARRNTMKLGVFTALFGDRTLKKTLDIIRPFELQTIEFGVGNYPGSAHLNVGQLLNSKSKRDRLLAVLEVNGLEISALSCHGNALHPDTAFAKKSIETLDDALDLAEKLGVRNVIDFAGCPGSDPKAQKPCWVTCPWPPDFQEILDWQWNEKVIPFWTKKAELAAGHGVRIAFEPHPGFVVYNPETLLLIRGECGNNIGANFDPSHFFWQGIDPVEAVRAIGGKAIFHVHAKDTKIYEHNCKVNGVLDTKEYSYELTRSWIFRTCGYGHGFDWWNDFVSTLRMMGYDGTLSIEHEDSLMSNMEGLTKAVEFLKRVVITQKATDMSWA
jgi:sugar phosphate isomerase/epimerase